MKGDKIVVPSPLVQDAISAHHDTLHAGHQGRNKTLELISRNFWWPSLNSDVAPFIQNCPLCQQNKATALYVIKRPMVCYSLCPYLTPDGRLSPLTLSLVCPVPALAIMQSWCLLTSSPRWCTLPPLPNSAHHPKLPRCLPSMWSASTAPPGTYL
jgi:hypothetical protein